MSSCPLFLGWESMALWLAGFLSQTQNNWRDPSLEWRQLSVIPVFPAALNTKMFYQNMPFPLSYYPVLSYTEFLFRLLKQAFLPSLPVLSKSELPHINTGGLTLLQGLFNSQLLQQECPEQPNADTLKRWHLLMVHPFKLFTCT